MSQIQGKVGGVELKWLSVPKGDQGESQVQLSGGRIVSVRWRRDEDGLWIETDRGLSGFDIESERTEQGTYQYQLSQRESDQAWADVTFVRAGEETAATAAGGKKKGTRIRAQMPGKILRILAQAGAAIAKDQPILVMEAMKMENEIRAPQAGTLTSVKVSEGQAVETGADLATIE